METPEKSPLLPRTSPSAIDRNHPTQRTYARPFTLSTRIPSAKRAGLALQVAIARRKFLRALTSHGVVQRMILAELARRSRAAPPSQLREAPSRPTRFVAPDELARAKKWFAAADRAFRQALDPHSDAQAARNARRRFARRRRIAARLLLALAQSRTNLEVRFRAVERLRRTIERGGICPPSTGPSTTSPSTSVPNAIGADHPASVALAANRRIEVANQALWRSPQRSSRRWLVLEARRARFRDACRALAAAHLGIVTLLARSRRNKALPLADLIQAGALGLAHAAHTFEPDLGFAFSTYAKPWIAGAMRRACDSMRSQLSGRTRKRQRTRSTVIRSRDALAALGGRSIASRRGDVSADSSSLDPVKQFEKTELAATLEAALAGLSSRDREILRWRFGMTDGKEHSFAEIARLLDVADESARKAHRKALERIASGRHASRLASFVDFHV